MFSDLYQAGERAWFLNQVKNIIYKELTKMYREAFISPWWRLMFKAALEKYVAKMVNSYQNVFPKVNMAEMIGPTERLMTKAEWELYLKTQAEKLANLVLRAEDKFEKVNEGYMLSLSRSALRSEKFLT